LLRIVQLRVLNPLRSVMLKTADRVNVKRRKLKIMVALHDQPNFELGVNNHCGITVAES